MPTIQDAPDWFDPQIAGFETGLLPCGSVAITELFDLTADGNGYRFITGLVSTDTAGYVTIGQGAVGDVFQFILLNMILAPGVPATIDFGSRGWWSFSAVTNKWGANHSVDGSTVSWQFGIGF